MSLLSFAIRSSKLDVQRSLVCFEPVLAGTDGDFEGAIEGEGFGHAAGEDPAEGVFFAGGGFEEELVVYLEEHAALQSGLADFAVDTDHGELDHIGGGSLNGHVDGVALGGVADAAVF